MALSRRLRRILGPLEASAAPGAAQQSPPKIGFDFGHHLPEGHRDDDVYLVSFPKSGNTWLRFLIGNAMADHLGLAVEVNFFTVGGFVPDVHAWKRLPRDMGFHPFRRIIKSHARCNPDYRSVIYVVRDPRSVMVSFHRYYTSLGYFKGDFAEFVRDPRYGAASWADHVLGWRERSSTERMVRFFRYEDFKSHPAAEAARLLRLLGMRPGPEALAGIIGRCDFAAMRELEVETGSELWTRRDPGFKFVREGRTDGWREVIAPEDLRYIHDVAGDGMRAFGYEF